MMETVAVYSEARPKIYGFIERPGLSLFRVACATKELERIGQWLRTLDGAGKFVLTLAHRIDGESLELSLVVESESDLARQLPEEAQVDAPPVPAEMVCFQGPHFGDRYGIAQAAFGTLAKAKVTLLAAVCAGATLQLVVPQGQAGPAVAALSEAFTTPTRGDAS